jgi:16S rRNA A1518/A1519 N6-dimethyltransferase RsmA/KsgA/DIM1 with predicted DNA glycosylase/AP lyase activity
MGADLPYNIATPLAPGPLERTPEDDRLREIVRRGVGRRVTAGRGRRATG